VKESRVGLYGSVPEFVGLRKFTGFSTFCGPRARKYVGYVSEKRYKTGY
jgi:hypothetical protein